MKTCLLRYITKSLEWTKFPGHSAEWCSWCVADILRELGHNVHPLNWKGAPHITGEFDVVFDVGRLLELESAFGDETIKILHLTGSDSVKRNQDEIERVRQVNERRGSNFKPQRLLPDPHGLHTAIELADFVILMGNRVTLDTYPEKYHDKIVLIDTVATMVE